MDWLKSLGENIWYVLGALAGLALFVQFGIPLGNWVWQWFATNVMVVIALALVGGVAKLWGDHRAP